MIKKLSTPQFKSTPPQKLKEEIEREGTDLQRIEEARGKVRMSEGGKQGNLNSNDLGQSLDHVAAALGISRDRWYKIKTVFEKAEEGVCPGGQVADRYLHCGNHNAASAIRIVEGRDPARPVVARAPEANQSVTIPDRQRPSENQAKVRLLNAENPVIASPHEKGSP